MRAAPSRWALAAAVGAMLTSIAPQIAASQEGAVIERLMQDGLAARRRGDFADATGHFERARDLAPRDTDVLLQLGLVYGFQERFKEAEATLRRAADLAPDSAEIALALARVMAWQGQYDAAAQRIDDILARHPGDLDARTFRSRIDLYRKRPAAAERGYRAILASDPDNVEALVGLGDARAAQGGEAEARTAWERAATLAPDQADIADRLRRGEPVGDRPWRLDSTVTYSDLSGGRKSWRETTHRLSRIATARTTLQAGFDVNERYGDTDVFLTIGARHAPTDWLDLRAHAGATPDASFRERWTAGGGASAALGETVAGSSVAIVDGRIAHYSTGNVTTLSPGLEQYLPGGRFWLTGRLISINDENGDWKHGWLVRGDAQITDDLRVYAGLSDAPETQDNQTVDTSALFLGLRYQLTDAVALLADYTHEDRESSYRRDAFTLGIGLAF